MAIDTIRSEGRAYKVIRELGIQKPTHLTLDDIAWQRGALVKEGGLRGADARLVKVPGSLFAIIRVNTSVSPPGRKRFAIAHELGHLELGHDTGTPMMCTERDFLRWYDGKSKQEVEANIFAAHLLMPQKLFKPRVEQSTLCMEAIEDLANEFQTTLTATAIRYVSLTAEPCALIFSKKGVIEWVHRSDEFGHWIPKNQKISADSCAGEYFAKGTLSTSVENVRLDAWVENASHRGKIKEQSRPMPKYNSVLTLLRIM